ncbi:hypothetical protein NPIL_446241 [Nephila pilipes]|uniref:Uncharacterized protein n=1 Tax=Nephila pilipes TaxID=299642 RepID=A0A8X6NXK8_NEPPI|nr:hypothetical protein NPIL_446241 [Nephila pilipes]
MPEGGIRESRPRTKLQQESCDCETLLLPYDRRGMGNDRVGVYSVSERGGSPVEKTVSVPRGTQKLIKFIILSYIVFLWRVLANASFQELKKKPAQKNEFLSKGSCESRCS